MGYFLIGYSSINFTRHLSDWLEVCRSFANGLSEFVNEISVGVTTFIFNWVMVTSLGMEGVAALTIVNYLLLAGLMFSYGIADSMQPIISQNFGAGNHHRINEFMRLSAIVVGVCGAVLATTALVFPEALVDVFLTEASVNTAEVARQFLSFLWPVFVLNCFSILISSYLTSMHKPAQSALIALARGFALPATFLLLLPIWMGTNGIFLSLTLAEALTLLIAIGLYVRNQPKKLVFEDMAIRALKERQEGK